ncbi:MAG: DUF4097 family beta strand repeat protein [Candidatus Eremiobacteraeota bacterium]|nr:DUF4097 family beta strand repeat protein [Candidatus Eremiobacteraeota bacterium]
MPAHCDASRVAVVLAITLGLFGCNGAFGERVHETVAQSVATGAAPRVRVENVAGTVRIVGWGKPEAEVIATKYGYDAQELRNISVAVRSEPAGVAVVTSYAAGSQGGGGHQGGVNYRISVPTAASLNVQNTAGAVDVDGIAGDVAVTTEAGEITASVGRVAGSRAIDLNATTGAITLTIAGGSSARVEAGSTVGNFSSDVPGVSAVRENVVGSRGSGTIGTGSGRIRLTTTTGAIALRER